MRFVHTTKLASDCMWKTLEMAVKMRCSTIQYNLLTLTYSIFHVNRNTFPEFSQILYQQFSTFHSTLVVNYPSQASFERSWMLLTAFLFLRAYWIVSAGPSGHLIQSIQKTVFEQRTTSTRLRPQNQRSCSATATTYFWLAFCIFEQFLFFRRRLESDQYRKTYRKTIKYEPTLDHARRP